MGKPIKGHDTRLVKAFEEAGILPENTRRMVIDIDCTGLVMIYYETFADERLLDVDLVGGIALALKELNNGKEKENQGQV